MGLEGADRQSMLRWTMASASDTRQTRAAAADNDERKGNVQPETAKRGQRAEHGENRRGTTKIDSFATLANDYTVVHDSTG